MEEIKTEKKTFVVKVKEKVKKSKEKWDKKKESAFHYLAEHPEVTMSLFSALGTIGIGTGIAISKAGRRNHEACEVEDDITGENLLLDHPLTNDEVMELNRRMKNGESKADILEDMGLLR